MPSRPAFDIRAPEPGRGSHGARGRVAVRVRNWSTARAARRVRWARGGGSAPSRQRIWGHRTTRQNDVAPATVTAHRTAPLDRQAAHRRARITAARLLGWALCLRVRAILAVPRRGVLRDYWPRKRRDRNVVRHDPELANDGAPSRRQRRSVDCRGVGRVRAGRSRARRAPVSWR